MVSVFSKRWSEKIRLIHKEYSYYTSPSVVQTVDALLEKNQKDTEVRNFLPQKYSLRTFVSKCKYFRSFDLFQFPFDNKPLTYSVRVHRDFQPLG